MLLKDKLMKLKKESLVSLVEELYKKNDNGEYIELFLLQDDPEQLFKKLRDEVNRWIRRKRFIPYRESSLYAATISEVEGLISGKLLPVKPELAWKLADKVVKKDASLLDACDDSSGSVGDALQAFVVLWVESAKALGKSDSYWIPRIKELLDENDYGIRDCLLEQCSGLLSQASLKTLYQEWKDAFLLNGKNSSYALLLKDVAKALKDPELYYSTYKLVYKDINNMLLMDVIEFFVECCQFVRAKDMLESRTWDSWEQGRAERLYKIIYRETGDNDSLVKEYEDSWQRDPSYESLNEYLDLVDEDQRDELKKMAVEKALLDDDPERGLTVLIELERVELAEEFCLKHINEFNSFFYGSLLHIIKLFKGRSPVSLVIMYRALLDDILNRAFSKGYHHAATYYRKLEELDAGIEVYPVNMESHTDYREKLHEVHFRKKSFWNQVKES